MSDDLDRLLEQALRTEEDPAVDQTTMQAFERRLIRRRRARRVVSALSVSVLGMTAVLGVSLMVHRGAAPPVATPSSSSNVVPWLDSPAQEPSPTPTSIHGIARCAASALSGSFLTTLEGAGNDANVLAFVDVGNRPCYIQGRPQVRLVTSDGRKLSPSDPGAGTFFPDEGPIPVRLEPGTTSPDRGTQIKPGQAELAIEWFDCDLRDRITQVLISIGGGTVTVRIDPDSIVRSGQAGCTPDRRTTPPLTMVNNFQAQRPGSEGSSDFAILSATIDAPKEVRPGTRLRYLVTLTNTGQIAVVFNGSLCPTYREVAAAGSDSSSRRYILNCAGVSIDPGAEIIFEMYIDLPSRASGKGHLTWTLDPDRSGGVPGSANVVFK